MTPAPVFGDECAEHQPDGCADGHAAGHDGRGRGAELPGEACRQQALPGGLISGFTEAAQHSRYEQKGKAGGKTAEQRGKTPYDAHEKDHLFPAPSVHKIGRGYDKQGNGHIDGSHQHAELLVAEGKLLLDVREEGDDDLSADQIEHAEKKYDGRGVQRIFSGNRPCVVGAAAGQAGIVIAHDDILH